MKWHLICREGYLDNYTRKGVEIDSKTTGHLAHVLATVISQEVEKSHWDVGRGSNQCFEIKKSTFNYSTFYYTHLDVDVKK